MFLENLLTDPLFFCRAVVIVVLSISLHELAHGYAAVWQGDDTPQVRGHMTLNPVVHMGLPAILLLCVTGFSWGQMPVDPSKFRSKRWGDLLVSAAGPMANLVLAIAAIFAIKFVTLFDTSGIISLQFFGMVAQLNLMLFIFNLLPVPPLDGFHVFTSFFPSFKVVGQGYFGLFLLVILFVSPVGESLGALTSMIVSGLVG